MTISNSFLHSGYYTVVHDVISLPSWASFTADIFTPPLFFPVWVWCMVYTIRGIVRSNDAVAKGLHNAVSRQIFAHQRHLKHCLPASDSGLDR